MGIGITGGPGLHNSSENNNIHLVTGVVDFSSGCTDIAASDYHFIVSKSGTLYACGLNNSGQLGDGTTTDRNTLVAMINVGVSGNTAIAAGREFTLVINNGTVYGCGLNNYGQLGDNTIVSHSTLAPMIGANAVGVSAIAANGSQAFGADGNHSLVLKNGVVYACGHNTHGQLGIGSLVDSHVLVPMIGPFNSGIEKIAAGAQHSILLKAGAIYTCGYNANGQLGDGTSGVDRQSLVAAIGEGTSGNLFISGSLTETYSLKIGLKSGYALYSSGHTWGTTQFTPWIELQSSGITTMAQAAGADYFTWARGYVLNGASVSAVTSPNSPFNPIWGFGVAQISGVSLTWTMVYIG